MSISQYFPVYSKLSANEQALLTQSASLRTVSQGTLIHGGGADCMGLLLIRSGQLRAYITSEEGKEITIYRLFEQDICLFSASCMMSSIQFDILITAEKDTEFWVVPTSVYKQLTEQNLAVSNYTTQIMATRFTDVMWLIEQIMWKSFDRRLATFLLEESILEGTKALKITHEKIASHLGSAREVVTRMLKYFQTENMVRLTRGTIQILDSEKWDEITD